MKGSQRALALFLYNSCLGVFLSYGLFFTSVSSEFLIQPTTTSLVFGTFAISYSISSLLMGFITDLYGAAKTIILGGSLMALGLTLSSFSSSPIMLIGTYGLLGGMGTGSMWLPTSLVTFEAFPEDKIREVIGMVSAGTAFGTIIFAPLEGLLISLFGWRYAIFTVGFIVLLFAIFAFEASKGIKITNSFNLNVAFSVFKGRRFLMLYSYYLLGNAFSRTLAMIFLVPMIESKGLGLALGSISLSLIGLGSIIGRLGTRIRWLSEEGLASAGFIIQGLSTLLFLFASDPLSFSILSVLFGIGYGSYIPQFALLVRKSYGMENYGTIFGTLLTSFGIGAFIGPVFEGYELTHIGSYTIGFIISSISSIIVGIHVVLGLKH